MSDIYNFSLTLLDGTPFDTQSLRGQVVLVVNVASHCGFTPQYAELEKLYRELEAQGFVILAFPCNQFGAQEPGSAEDIARFCSLNYGVTFPVMQKIEVNGTHADPLYRWLKKQKSGLLGSEAIKWNFTKFLIDTRGQVVERYAPQTAPETLRADIIRLLAV